MSRITIWFLSFCLSACASGLARGEATVCPGWQSPVAELDFSHEECRSIALSDFEMSDGTAWIYIPLDGRLKALKTDRPLGLVISGNLNLDAYLNGKHIGSKGKTAYHPESEIPGPFDWVGYVDKRLLKAQNNTLVLFLSSHTHYVPSTGYFNRLHLASFADTAETYKTHYALSLIPLGVMAIVFIYLLAQQSNPLGWQIPLSLLLMLGFAMIQLCLEVSRGFVPYSYPWHLPRLYGIAFFAFMFGQSLLLYMLREQSSNLGRTGLPVSVALTLMAMYLAADLDMKAIVAVQVPVGVLLVIQVRHWLQDKQKLSRSGMSFLMLFTSLLLMTFVTPAVFLDRYLYFFIAALLVLLAGQETHRLKHIQSTLRALQQATLDVSAPEKSLVMQTIKIKVAGRVDVIPVDTILYCQGAGDYVELVCQDKTVLYSGSLMQLQQQLPQDFLKVHRSYVVNTRHIQSIKRKSSGNGELQLSNDVRVPVSRTLFSATKLAVMAI